MNKTVYKKIDYDLSPAGSTRRVSTETWLQVSPNTCNGHSLRHTLVTRLSQADVPVPFVQCIVGHVRSGVTQEVYNREGYTLAQLKDAVDRFATSRVA
ncbi:tyrosine-type recombinase/integrase [Ruegeria meonggei]|uniref:tyrosine-type recombinase/integrase n=1 Tax=Ruegeria meonggei TaxID=1446476 RepID=UPI00366F3235